MRATSSSAAERRTSGAWRQLRRLVRLARVVWHILSGAVLAHTLLPLLRLERSPRRADALVRWWMRRTLHILAVRVHVEGRLHDAPTLFVCNHISWLDIICLRAAFDVSFVSKDDVARWPVIGAMAARAGTIFLARGRQDATSLTADRMTWTLQQRRHILIFPEGTTTDGRGVRPFFPRLYQAAIRTRSPVQAVALRYPHTAGAHPRVPFLNDDDLAHHLWGLMAEDAIEAQITFCAPIPVPGQDRRTLAAITHDQIAGVLDRNDADEVVAL
jgi:1-acyl-sn-glycerol-3-phosphate acyltransferase